MNLEQALGQRLLLWFEGVEPPAELLATLRQRPPGGVTLFRHLNGAAPAQVRALTAALQAAARAGGGPPLLVCADQEGGQLQGLEGLTAFPGAMALGATGSADLARQVGAALGRELAAVGVNVNFAPDCDVNLNPQNPVIGVRSFGEDPTLVARLAAAMTVGLQASGVAATAKHFPGHGDTDVDTHHGLAVIAHGRERLARVELPPFRAAIDAGVRLVMSAHLALPALTGRADLPATLAPELLRELLRGDLGFSGVVVSDALSMAGVAGGLSPGETVVRAAAAGVDLLLLAPPNDAGEAYGALLAAARAGRLAPRELEASARRVLALKDWLAEQLQPGLEVVGCAEHRRLAAVVAARAITLVRDTARQLPLCPPVDARIAVAVPVPGDLTLADTSSYERCDLAGALRRYHARIDEVRILPEPSPGEVAALAARLAGYDLVIAGTINAGTRPGQAALVRELLRRGTPVVAVALGLPYDLAAYPEAPTYLCSYGITPPTLDALAAALWGRAAATGRLPVAIPGLYAAGWSAQPTTGETS